eukprot:gene19126-biopygen14538
MGGGGHCALQPAIGPNRLNPDRKSAPCRCSRRAPPHRVGCARRSAGCVDRSRAAVDCAGGAAVGAAGLTIASAGSVGGRNGSGRVPGACHTIAFEETYASSTVSPSGEQL